MKTKFDIKVFDHTSNKLVDPTKFEEGQHGYVSYFIGSNGIVYVLYDHSVDMAYRETGHSKGPIVPILESAGIKPYENGGYGGVPIGEYKFGDYKDWWITKTGLILRDINRGSHQTKLEELLLELTSRNLVNGGKLV